MQYRRARLEGGTYFFTVNLADRQSALLTDKIDALRNAMSLAVKSHPFTIDAIVILPEHLHTLWTLPRRLSENSNFLSDQGKLEKITGGI